MVGSSRLGVTIKLLRLYGTILLKMFSLKDYRKSIHTLPFVPDLRAIQLCAKVDCTYDGTERKAGEMWQIEGPTTYIPSADVVIKSPNSILSLTFGAVISKIVQG